MKRSQTSCNIRTVRITWHQDIYVIHARARNTTAELRRITKTMECTAADIKQGRMLRI